jgi:Galactosyltransferase
LKEEKKMLEVNTTFNRELFDYMATHLRDTLYPGVENYTRYTVTRLGLLPLAGIEPLKPEYGPVINNVTSFGYPITVPGCQTSANQSVFIAVISSSGNFDKRNTIRQTWRTHLNVDYHQSSMAIVGFAFILGIPDNHVTQTQIEEESKTHGDIIQIGMSDFYRNLSLKVAGLFNWLYNFCPKIDFLFKVDDDVYVNVRNLAHFVQSHNRSDPSIFGQSAGNLFPVRGTRHFSWWA